MIAANPANECEKRKFSIAIPQGSQNDAHQFKFKLALPDRLIRFVNFSQLHCQLKLATVFEICNQNAHVCTHYLTNWF